MTGFQHHIAARVLIGEGFMSDIMRAAFGLPGAGCLSWAEARDTYIVGADGGMATGEGSDIWLECTIENRNTGREHLIAHSLLALGIREILRGYGGKYHTELLRAVALGDASAITGDIADHIVQRGIWGEVKYE